MFFNKFIDFNSCDMFSTFSNKDKIELLNFLKFYHIQYRELLTIPKNITFGVEIEACSKNETENEKLVNALKILNLRELNNKWYFDLEDEIPFCTEFTSPILNDSKESWIQLKKVCEVLRENNAFVTNNTGGHIHFGLQILGNNPKTWLNFIKLWSVYENIIYRFSYGEFEKERNVIEQFATPISSKYLTIYSNLSKQDALDLKTILNSVNPKYKREAIGLYNYRNHKLEAKKNSTLEIRCPNSSLEEIIWQNNINFFFHLLNYCSKDDFDHEVIEKRIYDILGIQNDISLYREIFIEQAFELCDLIFDNNLEKIYFLRQYLKNFSTSKDFVKCKSFLNN